MATYLGNVYQGDLNANVNGCPANACGGNACSVAGCPANACAAAACYVAVCLPANACFACFADILPSSESSAG